MKPIFASFDLTEYFFNKGYENSFFMPAFLKEKGLLGFEYSFSEGIHISDDGCEALKNEILKNDIFLSCYLKRSYDNFSDENYMSDYLKAAALMGAKRLVVPFGSCAVEKRSDVFEKSKKALQNALFKYPDFIICPETMGLIHDFGSFDEIIKLCLLNERLIPALNFPNIFSRNLGKKMSEDDIIKIFKIVENKLGRYRLENLHIYLSNVCFTNQGLKKYADFSENTGFDFSYKPVVRAIKKEKLNPIIICRSPYNPYDEACEIKKYYEKL